jgi:hypothetical protein
MPSTIPYDPSLILGNIVEKSKADTLKAIAEAQKGMNVAQDYLNALLLYKRSLDMTKQELLQMRIDTTELQTEIGVLGKQIATAATDYGKAVIKSQQEIVKIKTQSPQTQISEIIESPIDYNQSAIKPMPLSSDSMSMDVQFFRQDNNSQSSDDNASRITEFVSNKMNDLFSGDFSSSVANSVSNIVIKQQQKTGYQGTLVITATCTHKMADVFAPLIIDVDKAIPIWNAYHAKEKNLQINVDDRESILNGVTNPESNETEMLLLSGATYGSSFVGMVHIFDLQTTTVFELSGALSNQDKEAYSAQDQVSALGQLASWFANESGNFGMDNQMANTLRNLLSIANLSSHCSLITMGIIPSIQSHNAITVVKQLDGGADKYADELAAIQGSTSSAMSTLASGAQSAKDAQSIVNISSDYMKSAVSVVGDMDKQNNSVIDTNSMMTAFEDYVNKASGGNCGVPINFLLKPITQKQIIKAWVEKYYPNEFKTDLNLGDHPVSTTTSPSPGTTAPTTTPSSPDPSTTTTTSPDSPPPN